MYNIKIYGTNSVLTRDVNNLVSVADMAEVTYATIDLNCYFIRPHKANEGETYDAAGGVKESTSMARDQYDIETELLPQALYRVVEEGVTSINQYRYKFLEVTGYDIDPDYQPVDKLIPIVMSEKSYNEEGALKNLTITLLAKYPTGQN